MSDPVEQKQFGGGFDPRPVVTANYGASVVAGRRCQACHHPSLEPAERCPCCGEAMADATFGPAGTVFAGTVLRIPVGERTPPLSLAYVDLDDGPRVLGHGQDSERALRPGERVVLAAADPQGDPVFRREAP